MPASGRRAAFGWDNDGVPHGGYVGIPPAQERLSQALRRLCFYQRGGFDKVVFWLIEGNSTKEPAKTLRRMLPMNPYQSMIPNIHTSFENNSSRREGNCCHDNFKLNSLVKDLVENQDHTLADKKIVFIIDEAHRTTMGQMMGTIKSISRKTVSSTGIQGLPCLIKQTSQGELTRKVK